MSEMLQLLVIHPHDNLMPGDIVDMTEDQYEERVRNHPFPYFSVLSGALLKSVAGTRLPAAPPEQELPKESAPAIPSVAAELALENLEEMTAHPGELHAEGYEPEVAPPFAADATPDVIDESTPVAEPIAAVLEAPASEPEAQPMVETTVSVEEARFMEVLPQENAETADSPAKGKRGKK